MQELQPIADEAGQTTAKLAIAWVLQNKNVATAVVANVKAAGVPWTQGSWPG